MNTWITDQELFPTTMNQELLQEIINLKVGGNEQKARFAMKYNLSYLGEIAERWRERDMVKNERDLRSLIIGLTLAGRESYLYDQEKAFVSGIRDYLATQWDSISAAALLNFSWAKFSDSLEADDILDRLKAADTSAIPPHEKVLLICLLSDIMRYNLDHEGLLAYIIQQIEQLELNLEDAHAKYPFVVMLSNAYVQLGKPSTKLFKNKTKAKWIRTLYFMSTKELPSDSDAHTLLEINKEELYSYNYLLSKNQGIGKSTFTGPGLERVLKRYLETVLWSETTITNQIFERLKGIDYRNFDPFFEFLDHKYQPRFTNTTNLRYFLDLTEQRLLQQCNPSYVILLKRNVLPTEMENEIIQKILCFHGYGVTKELSDEDFIYVENLRNERGLDMNPNKLYTNKLIHYGFITTDDITVLEQRHMVGNCIQILKDNNNISELIILLGKMKNDHLKILLSEFNIDNILTLVEHPPFQKLLYYYLQALYHFNPKRYASTIYDLLKSDHFRVTFGLTDEQCHQLEVDLIDSTLLSASEQNMLKRKHMSDQERCEADWDNLCVKINNCHFYSMESLLVNNINSFRSAQRVRNAYLRRLKEFEVAKHQLPTIVMNYQILRTINLEETEEFLEFEEWLTSNMQTLYQFAI